MTTRIIYILILFAAMAGQAIAQAPDTCRIRQQERKRSAAWEIGLGGSVFQFNRINFVRFSTTDAGYYINMKLRHAVYGGNIYVARELTNVFALDFQGALGYADEKWLAQAGLGLQWRLGHYFKSRNIDPYLRIGGNYLYKGFDILYSNSQGGMDWDLINNQNKSGADGRHLLTVAGGVGVNMWLNDRFGIGLQGDYLLIPKPDVANSLQGTVRVMRRFGHKPASRSDHPAACGRKRR